MAIGAYNTPIASRGTATKQYVSWEISIVCLKENLFWNTESEEVSWYENIENEGVFTYKINLGIN